MVKKRWVVLLLSFIYMLGSTMKINHYSSLGLFQRIYDTAHLLII